jgi:cell wall-associated NlpC family hydrolase
MPNSVSVRLVVGAAVLSALTSACASDGTAVRPAAFPTTSASPSTPAGVEAVVQSALALRGTKYRLGGQDPRRGLDCSGLVSYVFGRSNVSLPRTVDEQFGAGQVIDFDRIQAGDLLFFATTKAGLEVGAATHVGIAVGPPSLGEFVHAPGTGSSVRVDRFDAPFWRARYVGARRVFVASPALVSR